MEEVDNGRKRKKGKPDVGTCYFFLRCKTKNLIEEKVCSRKEEDIID